MATRIVIVVDEDRRDNEALKVRVAAVAAKIGDGNREGKDHVTRYEVVAISDPGPPDPGHVVKIGSLRDGPTLRDALAAMVQELRAERTKIHVTSSSDENRGVAAGLYRAADMLDAILAAEAPTDSLTMAQGAIDHYREGLYEILRGDTGRSHREVAATYLGEDVPNPVPDPGKAAFALAADIERDRCVAVVQEWIDADSNGIEEPDYDALMKKILGGEDAEAPAGYADDCEPPSA